VGIHLAAYIMGKLFLKEGRCLEKCLLSFSNNEMLVFVAFLKNARRLRMKRFNKEYPLNYTLKIFQGLYKR
jgi:hypothetical protein